MSLSSSLQAAEHPVNSVLQGVKAHQEGLELRSPVGVLPLVDVSGAPRLDDLSLSLATEIVSQLRRRHGLAVVLGLPPTGSRREDVSLRELGHVFGADLLLLGSVRSSASAVELHAELVDTVTGVVWWAGSCTVPTTADSWESALASEVAAAIADALLNVHRGVG